MPRQKIVHIQNAGKERNNILGIRTRLGYNALMDRRRFLRGLTAALFTGPALAPKTGTGRTTAASKRPPNVILFLADDLGYAQLGCMGDKKIRTPAIDRLAAEGVRFTQAYSGSPVCAPSRCVLLTGLHTGHAAIRDNREIQPEGQEPLPADAVTLPKLLHGEGYATACVGKWGLGFPGSSGEPNGQGFDLFFGYNCQRHAHNHYPAYLWRNREKVVIEGNDGGLTGAHYAPDLFETEAMDFIRQHRRRPFFLYYATTIPHLALQVPADSLAEYDGAWPETPYDRGQGYLPCARPRATYAAMVTRMDRSVRRITALLSELRLAEDTLVIFASDNGSTYDVGGYDMEFFGGTGGLRMHKGYVYEGGIRVPLIARWPGRVAAGRTSGHVCAFQDLLPTILDAAGAARRVPVGIDGLSFLPTLTGQGPQARHGHLYMEFADYGGQQMAREGRWKAVRSGLQKNPDAPVELYDLDADRAETTDLAASHPDVVGRLARIMRSGHRPSKVFPFHALDAPPAGGPGRRAIPAKRG
jgi:arylsulfatase A